MRQTMFGRRFWALVLVALALVTLTGLTGRRTRALSLPGTVLAGLLAPVEGVFTSVAATTSAVYNGVAGLWSLRADNARLQQQVAELQAQADDDAQARAQTASLQAMLDLSSTLAANGVGSSLFARVVARNADAWFDAVVVNRGSRSGVAAGMVAVTPDGLVGRVTAGVGPGTAQVMLITNPDFGAGVLVERSRAEGVAVGRVGTAALTVTFFSPDADVQVGDQLVTSGIAIAGVPGGFPPGLAVGTVSSVYKGDFNLAYQALVTPAAHLDSLEDLMLLSAPGAGTTTP